MPVYYNDGLDDPVQYDRQASFVGGQISNFRENLLNESQAESLKDLDTEKNGILKSRRGFHRFADLLGTATSTNTQGLAYFDTDTKEQLIAFVNSNVYGINSAGVVTVSGLGTGYVNSSTNLVDFCQVADRLYYASHSGSNRVGQIKWTGSTWEIVAVPDGPTNSKFLVNNSFRIFAVQPSDNQVYVSDILPNVTGAINSLDIANAGTGYSAGTLSATGGGGSSFAGTYTVDGSGKIATVTITNAGTGYTSLPTIVVSHAGDGNAVITPAFATVFPSANAFKVGLGDPITGMASWVGFNVVVFCKNSCYVIDTNPVPATSAPSIPAASTFKIRTISTSNGCLSHGSIAQVGEDLYYLSRTGIRSIRRTMEENMVASDVGVISYPIQDVIDQINWAKADIATGIFWRGRYILSVPTGASLTNDSTIVYNTNTQSWMGVWRGDVTVAAGVESSYLNPTDYAVTQFTGGKPFLISLDKIGNPLQFRDFVEDINLVDTDYQDKSTTTFKDTGWEVTTRAFTFGEQMTTKDAEFAEFEFDRSDAIIDIGVLLDNESSENLADELDTGSGELRLTFTLPSTLGSGAVTRFRYSMTQYPEFRELQFNFKQSAQAGTDSKYLALRSIHAGGFLNSVGVES
jgi:hypothetical protein|tara:strand:- start:2902 stop:4797 length:1896 start_codon:yes stop_codon:yes gene_type:complete